jgi:putative ABC transport system permease protein
LWQGMVPALLGAGAGVLLAVLLGQPIANLLYGISPHDPFTLAFVSITLSLVALVACYVPARNATRVDPVVAFRYD